jgi:hypothetical protein
MIENSVAATHHLVQLNKKIILLKILKMTENSVATKCQAAPAILISSALTEINISKKNE